MTEFSTDIIIEYKDLLLICWEGNSMYICWWVVLQFSQNEVHEIYCHTGDAELFGEDEDLESSLARP